MKHLTRSLLSLSLAALLLGCGTTSDEAPLIPEIVSIEIDGANTDSTYSLEQKNLTATVTYDDGTSSTAVEQLTWDSNDTTVLSVHNGLTTPQSNNGTVALSASFRDKLYTQTDKNMTIIPLTDVNITSTDLNISDDINASVDINTSGSYALLANGIYEDNTTVTDISSHIVWRSSNTTIATVDTAGLLTIGTIDANSTVDINVSIYNEINATLELNITTNTTL